MTRTVFYSISVGAESHSTLLATGNSFCNELTPYSFSAVEPDLLVRLVLVGVAGVPLVAVGGNLLQPRVL